MTNTHSPSLRAPVISLSRARHRCRYRGSDLALQSVSNVSSCTDPTFGPCTKIELTWAKSHYEDKSTSRAKSRARATPVMTTSIVALQSEQTPGILFGFTLPGGLAACSTAQGTDSVTTAWPVFDTAAGELELASLALRSQSTESGAWGPSTRSKPIAAHSDTPRATGGAQGGLPLVLWPHAATPSPPPPPPGPGPHTKKWGCRVVPQGTDVTLTASMGGYGAYTPSKQGSGYDRHEGEYCGTHPTHTWAYTADVDEARAAKVTPFRDSFCAAHSFYRIHPGYRYRCGKSTFKRAACGSRREGKDA